MHITPFHAFYPEPTQLAAMPNFFDKAKDSFQELVQSNAYLTTHRAFFFIYQIQTKQRHYAGVLACTNITDYLQGDIKKHEATMPEEEVKQLQFMLERRAAVKPVLLTYPDAPSIDTWISGYMARHDWFLELHFDNALETHRLWAVQEEQNIQQLQSLFETAVPHAYIADGHHRMAAMGLIAELKDTALRQQFQQVYCAFFPSTELDILAFNRIVEVSPDFDMHQLEPLFHIQALSAAANPTQLHEMTLCTSKGWFRLNWKQEILQAFANESVVLDTLLLNEKVLQQTLGIKDVRHDRRVVYIEAPKGLEAIENKIAENPNYIGFCLFPVAFDALMTLVESGKTLPPKSTWFEPRMKNGLIVKTY